MNTTESFDALRRANPRAQAGFESAVEDAATAVKAAVETSARTTRPRRLVGVPAVGASLAAVAIAAVVVVGSLGGGPGVESATAAFKQAATITAASAERSGTAAVRIEHNGEFWAGTTVRWNGDDVSIGRDAPSRPGKVGDEMRVVDGVLYGRDREGLWLAMGSPRNIDPGSGTTPDEYLAAVRADVGGVTLQRFTRGMSGLTKVALDDGSAVYRGTVAAGLIAPETGFKEGQAIRVFPFGYVAHDEAANPQAQLDVAVTVGADDVVREIAVTWGMPTSSWVYTVAYSGLGTTAAPVAPPNARDLLKERLSFERPTPSADYRARAGARRPGLYAGSQPSSREIEAERSRRSGSAASTAAPSKRVLGPWSATIASSSPRADRIGAAIAVSPGSRSPTACA